MNPDETPAAPQESEAACLMFGGCLVVAKMQST